MKILVIGDIHGYPSWKKVVKHETYDKVIFIGDYFDSFHNAPKQQQKNFKEIYEFWQDDPKRVILLCGNHDFHYLKDIGEYYSGFNRTARPQYEELLEEAITNKAIQLCFIYKNFVITHAGLTKTWCRMNEIDYTQPFENIEAELNELFYYRRRAFMFSPGHKRNAYGDEPTQGPLWVRPNSLLLDKIKGIHIVGHTQQDEIRRYKDVVLIDAMSMGEYLAIINDELFVNRVTIFGEITSRKLETKNVLYNFLD